MIAKARKTIDLSKIRRNTEWNGNIKGEWVIINDDGTVHADGFDSFSDAKLHLAYCNELES